MEYKKPFKIGTQFRCVRTGWVYEILEVIGFDSVRGFHYKVKFGVPGEVTPIGTEKAFHYSFLQYPYEPLYNGRRVRV